jgi:hypothetical protein
VAPATNSRKTYLPVGRVASDFSKVLVASTLRSAATEDGRLVLFVFTGVRFG